jgi:hypothetical protein
VFAHFGSYVRLSDELLFATIDVANDTCVSQGTGRLLFDTNDSQSRGSEEEQILEGHEI